MQESHHRHEAGAEAGKPAEAEKETKTSQNELKIILFIILLVENTKIFKNSIVNHIKFYIIIYVQRYTEETNMKKRNFDEMVELAEAIICYKGGYREYSIISDKHIAMLEMASNEHYVIRFILESVMLNGGNSSANDSCAVDVVTGCICG